MSDRLTSQNGRYELVVRDDGRVSHFDFETGVNRDVLPAVAPGPVPPQPSPPIPPGPPTSRRGLVRQEGRALVDDGGAFCGLGASFFWALWGMKHDRARTLQNLDWLAAHGAEAYRVLCAVGWNGPNVQEDSWFDRTVDPNWPDYQDQLDQLFLSSAVRGLRVIPCAIADVTRLLPDGAARRRHVERVCEVANRHPTAVLNLAVSNEGLGFDDPEEIVDLAVLMRDRTPFLVSTTADMNRAPQTVFAGRSARKIEGDGGIWEHTEQPYKLKGSGLIGSDEEPIGPESSIAADDDPLRTAAHAACAWICESHIYLWHPGAGIRGGGEADRLRGRHANFWEQPTGVESLRLLNLTRDALPDDVSSWGNIAHSDPGMEGRYPFKTAPLQPFNPSGWFLKTYSARRDPNFACVFLKVEQDVPLEAPAPMTFWVSDLRGAVEVRTLQPGQRHVVTHRGAFVVSGTYL